MKPLSVIKYYKNNFKKTLPIITAVILSICLLYSLCMIGGAIKEAIEIFYKKPFNYYSIFHLNSGIKLNNEFISRMKNYQYIKEVIPLEYRQTTIRVVMGVQVSSSVLFIPGNEIRPVIENFPVKLSQGKLPRNDKELALHWRVAADKDLNLGELMGSKINEEEPLKGSYKVVGLLTGPCVISLGITEKTNITQGIVIPKQGKMKQVNEFLNLFLPAGSGRILLNNIREDAQDLNNKLIGFLTILELAVLIVLSITIANITYIYYYHRRKEFGILNAVGYSRRQILKRVFKEITIINSISFLLGILLAVVTGSLLNVLVLDSIGEELLLWDPSFLLITLIIPVIVTISSLVPVVKLVTKLDKIEIIEGVD